MYTVRDLKKKKEGNERSTRKRRGKKKDKKKGSETGVEAGFAWVLPSLLKDDTENRRKKKLRKVD